MLKDLQCTSINVYFVDYENLYALKTLQVLKYIVTHGRLTMQHMSELR